MHRGSPNTIRYHFDGVCQYIDIGQYWLQALFLPLFSPFLTQFDLFDLSLQELYMMYFVLLAQNLTQNAGSVDIGIPMKKRCDCGSQISHFESQIGCKCARMQPNLPFPHISIHIGNKPISEPTPLAILITSLPAYRIAQYGHLPY